jgi:ubiquinone/menaquinone biosynthesis C-methylase UbiE
MSETTAEITENSGFTAGFENMPPNVPVKSDYDRLAATYAKHRWVNPRVLDSLVREIADTETRVLEVGAGTGNHILALVERTGCEGHGVEPSREMRTRAEARGGKVAFAEGAAEHLEYETDSFDLVFSVDVIHHLQDRARFYAAARRVLKPGGQVCTVTDSEDILRHRQPLSFYFPETVAVELERYPTIATLRAEMAGAGFGDICEESVVHAFVIDSIAVYRDKAFSSLHYIDDAAHARGLARMEADLAAGLIDGVSRYLLLWGTA